jgi:hypothetical protein
MEKEQIDIIIEQREKVPPEKSIRDMTDAELDEYWVRIEVLAMQIEAEMARRGLD